MSVTNFLHGIRTLEYDDGTKEINTVDISVIGIVGTATNVAEATRASLTWGSSLADNLVEFSTVSPGSDGNKWVVEIVDMTVEGATCTPGYSTLPDGTKKLTMITEPGMTPGKMYDQNQEYREGKTDGEWINVTFGGEHSGTGTVFGLPPTNLSGGTADALIVVVRVVESSDDADMSENVIAGINSLLTSAQINEVTPRIIIAPDYSARDEIAAQLEVVANKLRGVCYIDSPRAATPADVVNRRQKLGGRAELLRPRVYSTSDVSGLSRPYSAIAAGLRARIDNEKGFWWSKSNQNIYGVTGLEQVDDFIIGETNCTANLLNASQVSTIIRYDGFRHWGNYLCSLSPQWSFESVRRTADVIEDSIARAMMTDFIVRPIDLHLGTDVVESINAYLHKLEEQGAINGGRAWLDSELNTKESLAAGNLYINVDFGPKSPAQTITLMYRINNDYTVEALASLFKEAA